MSWYRTGTVALTNGSATVTGTGTAFIANASIGEAFLGPDGRTYEITGISSNTSLTISPSYLGSNVTGAAYAIAPLRGRIADLIAETSSLLNSFATVRDGIGAGLFPDGTVSLPGLRFSADQDTGVARTGTNTMALVCGGQSQVAIAPGSVGLPSSVTVTGVGTSDAVIEVGAGRSGNGASYIDLHGSAGVDFSARMARLAGVNGNLILNNSGTGNIDIQSGGDVAVVNAGTVGLYISASSTRPGGDNVQSIGTGSIRWSVVFAATGTINTSDEREKTWRGHATAAELTAARRIVDAFGFFQWNDAIAEKGEDGARMHFGVKAQAVWQIMADEGLIDPIGEDGRPGHTPYAFLCFDEWEAEPGSPAVAEVRDEDGKIIVHARPAVPPRPAGNRFGLRIDQLTMFLLAALAQRVAALEAAA